MAWFRLKYHHLRGRSISRQRSTEQFLKSSTTQLLKSLHMCLVWQASVETGKLQVNRTLKSRQNIDSMRKVTPNSERYAQSCLTNPLRSSAKTMVKYFFGALTFRVFKECFDAVVDDAQHLLVTSHYDGVIDHYGRMMLNRLKMRSGMAVETYMPASTEALVTRFNELVNSMSMEEARGEQTSQTPGRIIVVNDPKAIDSDGWALLSRMVTDFLDSICDWYFC